MVTRFMEEQAATWECVRKVALRTAEAIYECLNNIRQRGVTSAIGATVRFNELRLDVVPRCEGPAI
jgi:hypothetical protein